MLISAYILYIHIGGLSMQLHRIPARIHAHTVKFQFIIVLLCQKHIIKAQRQIQECKKFHLNHCLATRSGPRLWIRVHRRTLPQVYTSHSNTHNIRLNSDDKTQSCCYSLCLKVWSRVVWLYFGYSPQPKWATHILSRCCRFPDWLLCLVWFMGRIPSMAIND